jgi:hypothetical protein
MRLLNTTTLEFEEFVGRPTEEYAILSHRWGDEEVSFKEYRKSRETLKHRAGYKKITQFCEISKQRGYRLAWIDTCCIDKRSSAELSEAINSMYEWYARSAECYVWLEDYSGNLDDLHRCAWFNRGWTLQEMLAPERVIFFTAHWEIIGHKIFTINYFENIHGCPCKETRTTSSLGPHIAPWLVEASGIPERYLSGRPAKMASIAERMSWASHRQTTRVEDQAYSLLGLFDINMPLLYGEGSSAFRRLQGEIVRTSSDTSVFCIPNDDGENNAPGLLAVGPSGFSHCRGAIKGHIFSSEPYSLTNRGLRLCATAQFYKSETVLGRFSGSLEVYKIDLGWTIGAVSGIPLKLGVAQYVYLEPKGNGYQYHRSYYTGEDISQDMRKTNAEWVDVGEKVFFIDV